MNINVKNAIVNRIHFLEKRCDQIVIDGDTHLTDLNKLTPDLHRRYHSTFNYYQGRPIQVEDLLREMEIAGVDMALSWQNPATTIYRDDKSHNFETLLAANRYIFESARKFPDRIIPAGWTDPKALGVQRAIQLAEVCIRDFGFCIVKMNPAQNQFYIDHPDVIATVEAIVAMGAFPAFHFGGDSPYTPASGLQTIAQQHPDCPIIAVHMGGGGSHYEQGDQLYLDARDLGLKQSNIFYILSAKRDTHIESDLITYQLAGPPFQYNIACASDAPYGKVYWNFGGYRQLFRGLRDFSPMHPDPRVRSTPGLFDDQAIQNYMGANLARLVIKASKNILHRQFSDVS